MPWPSGSGFAKSHNKKLKGKAADVAAKVATEVLEKTGDEGKAIREGNAVGDRAMKKKNKHPLYKD